MSFADTANAALSKVTPNSANRAVPNIIVCHPVNIASNNSIGGTAVLPTVLRQPPSR
jgi:hypothetical protein